MDLEAVGRIFEMAVGFGRVEGQTLNSLAAAGLSALPLAIAPRSKCAQKFCCVNGLRLLLLPIVAPFSVKGDGPWSAMFGFLSVELRHKIRSFSQLVLDTCVGP